MVYLTQVKGLDIKGNAIDIVPNVGFPIAGGVVLFHYPNGKGHAAYIEAILPNGNLFVTEWNYYRGKPSERVIRKDSSDIYGYYFESPNSHFFN